MALAALALSMHLVRRYVLNALGGLDRGDGYYVADDYAAGRRILNACVPMIPGLRAIIVSRGLVEALSEEEVMAVVEHEEGHLRYNHPLLYTASLATFFSAYHVAFRAITDHLGP